MHIPDGFLTPGVAATTTLAAGGALTVALRAERREPEPMPAGMIGAIAAFLFAVQAVNVPIASGTSAHLIGSMLATVLLGPWRAMLAVASVLAVQAIFIHDGGLTSLGANFVDMGVAGCVVGYAVAYGAGRWIGGVRGIAAGAVLGGFAATLSGAVLAALWLSLSGLSPITTILPLMIVSHVAMGLLEAALTGAIVVSLLRVRPDLARGVNFVASPVRPAAVGGGMFGLAVVVAAFVAPLSSRLPDGLTAIAEALGFASRSHAIAWSPWGSIGPAAAGGLGTVAAAGLAWLISRSLSTAQDVSHR